jgi:hypothetical protein
MPDPIDLEFFDQPGSIDLDFISRVVKGEPGLNAYKIAVKEGFVGTEQEWLESLEGEAGSSAYEIAVDQGFVGTVQEWLAFLKGEKGDTGDKGDIGDKGDKGDKGDTGDPGESAYQIAVSAGFVGTEAEWLASLNGADGPSIEDLTPAAIGAVATDPTGITGASAVTNLVKLSDQDYEELDPKDPGTVYLNDTGIHLGDNRVGQSERPHSRLLEEARWLWWNTVNNGVTFIPHGNDYNVTTQAIVATANVAIPTPGMLNIDPVSWAWQPGSDFLDIDGSKPWGSPGAVAEGMKVGDRIVRVDDVWYGFSGVYVITDLGENGVRPWRIERAADHRADNLGGFSTVYVVDPSDEQWQGRVIIDFYPGNQDWADTDISLGLGRVGLSPGAVATNYAAAALGIYSVATKYKAIAIGPESLVMDEALVGISGRGTNDSGGAYVRKRARNVPGTAYTFASRDEGAIVRFTSSSSVTALIPVRDTVDPWRVSAAYLGIQLEVIQSGNGVVTIGGVAGVTVTGQTSSNGIGSRLVAVCVANNLWEVTCIPAPSALATATQGAKADLALPTDPTGIIGASALANIVRISAEDYNALTPKDSNTLYIVED